MKGILMNDPAAAPVSNRGNVDLMFRYLKLKGEPVAVAATKPFCHIGIVQIHNAVAFALSVENCQAVDLRANWNGLPSTCDWKSQSCRSVFRRPRMVVYTIKQLTKKSKRKVVVNLSGRKDGFIHLEILIPKGMPFHLYGLEDGRATKVISAHMHQYYRDRVRQEIVQTAVRTGDWKRVIRLPRAKRHAGKR